MLIVRKIDKAKEAHMLNEDNQTYNAVEWKGQYYDLDYRGIIAILRLNGYLKVQFEESKEKAIELPEEKCCLNDNEFYIRDCILNYSAHAACDGSKKDNLFGGHCVTTDASRSKSIKKTCKSNRWEINNVQTTEGCPLMMLLELIFKIGKNLPRGKIIIFMDRKHLIRYMLQGKIKPSQHTQDCSAIKSRYDQIKKELSIEIEIKHASNKIEEGAKYEQNKGGHLMKECDVNSKEIRRSLENETGDVSTVNCVGNNALIVNGVPCDRSIKETVRIIDSNAMAMRMCKHKFKDKANLVNLSARKQFHGATRSAVKCMIGFNHYAERHKTINMNLPSNKCPRCNAIETWSHVIQCESLRTVNEDIVEETHEELKKKVNTELQDITVSMIKKDLKTYLLNESNEFNTNQAKIGWKQAFRGHAVKLWNDQCEDACFNHEMSKVIIKKCTNHCIKCWNDRNEKYHDEEKQREHVVEWTEALEQMMLRSNKIGAIRCLINQTVNIQNTSTTKLQNRNKHLIEVCKRSKDDNKSGDIRQCVKVVDAERNASVSVD